MKRDGGVHAVGSGRPCCRSFGGIFSKGLVYAVAHGATAFSAWAVDLNGTVNPTHVAPGAAPAVPTTGSVANTMSLFLAVLLAAVGAWLMWRNRQAQRGGGSGHSLAVEETKALGNRQYLVVASYEGRKFLLGVCPGRIDMLAPLNNARSSEETST